jgi:membrane-bound lytic murein transglycosylase D
MRSAIIAAACAALCVFAFSSVAAANEPQADAAPAAPAATTAAAAAPSAAPSRDPLGELLESLPDAYSEWPYDERESGARPRVAGKPPSMRVVVPPAPPPGDLWVRIRRGFRIPDLETKLAENRTLWYANQPDYFDRMAQRSSRYLYHIVEEIERRDMPTELALLPFVESAFVPEAISSAKAAGLWQFIPSTGKTYELEQNMWLDERRDVVESTRAALDYLQKLYDQFGDWHLALAAYNWGEGAVSRAIAKNQRARKPAGYTDLRMPNETQYYVPKLQAIKNIVSDPGRYGVVLPKIDDTPYFVAVHKTRDIDVHTAARLAELDVDEFLALNPSFNRPVIVGAGGAKLLLPAKSVDRFHANLAAWDATGQPLASWTVYKMTPADTLAAVARRVGISEEKLREANRIPPRYVISAGSTILIPRDETMESDIPADSLDARFALVPEQSNLRKVTYRVRRGDTLFSVARRYRVDEKDVIVWNHLTAPTLFAGQRLELTVPAAKAPVTAKGGSKAKPSARASAAHSGKAPAAKAVTKSPARAPGKVIATTR